MQPETLEEILSCPNLPSLPAVAVRVIELTHNANVSLDELAMTVQNDQALAAKVLRTVNSSFYGLRRRCATIQQSLVVLGLSTVKSLTLGFSLVQTLGGGREGPFDHVAYWRRGLYTAIGAKLAARAAGRKFEDEAFLAGLLQDVGMMAMRKALGERYDAVLARGGPHAQLVRHELELLDLQHPDVGAMLAQRWKLPDELVVPVKYHERPTAAPQEHADCVRCVALGNLLHDVLTDKDSARALRTAYARGKAWLGFDATTVDELVREVSSSARELSSLFTLETGAYRDADEVLRYAERRLMELSAETPADDEGALEALLQEHCRTDPATGAVGRDEFVFEVRSAHDRCVRSGEALTVVFARLDGSAGDPAASTARLAAASVILHKHFDPSGAVLGRWSEDSLALLVSGVGTLGAMKLASLAREDIERAGLGSSSFGLASVEAGTEEMLRVELLLAAAGRAVEVAQAAGGNCVRVFKGGEGRRAA